MQLGFVGLGKMGLNMVTRLQRGGHAVVAFDHKPEAVERARAAGATGAASLDLPAIAQLWTRGSVVRSWLLELTARALEQDPRLDGLEGHVEDSGESRWTLHEGIDRAVPLPVLTAALFTRFRSRSDNPFGERLLAALRQQFGGHAVKGAPPPEPPRS